MVVLGIGHLDAKTTQVISVLLFVVIAGEHDPVSRPADVQDRGHGVAVVVPAGHGVGVRRRVEHTSHPERAISHPSVSPGHHREE